MDRIWVAIRILNLGMASNAFEALKVSNDLELCGKVYVDFYVDFYLDFYGHFRRCGMIPLEILETTR